MKDFVHISGQGKELIILTQLPSEARAPQADLAPFAQLRVPLLGFHGCSELLWGSSCTAATATPSPGTSRGAWDKTQLCSPLVAWIGLRPTQKELATLLPTGAEGWPEPVCRQQTPPWSTPQVLGGCWPCCRLVLHQPIGATTVWWSNSDANSYVGILTPLHNTC